MKLAATCGYFGRNFGVIDWWVGAGDALGSVRRFAASYNKDMSSLESIVNCGKEAAKIGCMLTELMYGTSSHLNYCLLRVIIFYCLITMTKSITIS